MSGRPTPNTSTKRASRLTYHEYKNVFYSFPSNFDELAAADGALDRLAEGVRAALKR